MIDFIFHSSPCKIYIFYAFTVIYPSIKKDIELELELELVLQNRRCHAGSEDHRDDDSKAGG